jgi:site-specific DNA-cytosine methylase
MTGWGFTDRPSLVINNAVFRGMVGGSGAKAAIVSSLHDGTYIPSPHGSGERDHTQATRITPAEAGVLQSFRPDYPWTGSKTNIGRMIGDTVPPVLAAAIVDALLPKEAHNDEG